MYQPELRYEEITMPHDPDTFKNLYPFPDKNKIRQSFEDFCRENPQELPKEFRTKLA